MTDMFHEKDRGKSLAIASLFPYLGPALGPILGGLVSQLVEWPWLFYIVSIVEAVVLVLGILVLRETYTPVLLRRKAVTLSRAVEADLPTIATLPGRFFLAPGCQHASTIPAPLLSPGDAYSDIEHGACVRHLHASLVYLRAAMGRPVRSIEAD